MQPRRNPPGGPARYQIHEGDLPLSVPGQWEDQSLNVLRLPGDGHAVASLVVSRDQLPVGLSVPAYTEQELHRLAKTLPGFELKARIPVDWPDGRGEALLTRWKSDSGLMDQITACRLAYGQRLLIFTATHASPMPTGLYNTVLAAITGFRPRPVPDGTVAPPSPEFSLGPCQEQPVSVTRSRTPTPWAASSPVP